MRKKPFSFDFVKGRADVPLMKPKHKGAQSQEWVSKIWLGMAVA